jgi:hypothetical protein
MVTKLDMIHFVGMSKILEKRMDVRLSDISVLLGEVIRSLKGGHLRIDGLKRNLMKLSKIRTHLDDVLIIRGLGNASGDEVFNEVMRKAKAYRLSSKSKKSKSKGKAS